MEENVEIRSAVNNLCDLFEFVHKEHRIMNDVIENEYKKINLAYFKMFSSLLESFLILIKNNRLTSGLVLMRTMLELFVKSFYIQFIEQENQSSILDFLKGKKDFPKFHEMVRELEKYENTTCGNFKGSFIQFTKKGLSSYEKFSLFTHGRGEILVSFYENNNISYTPEQVLEVLETAKGLFLYISLLFFCVQDKKDAFNKLYERIRDTVII